MNLRLLLALTWFLVLQPFGFAAENPADSDSKLAEAKALALTLKPQAGEVLIKPGLVKAKLPDDMRFLSPDDSRTVLKDIWGNPLHDKPLGMIVPANFDPLEDASWAVVIEYSDDGHVSDSDAAKVDYNALLQQMKKSAAESNEERKKQGYPTVELVGWATAPRYDAGSHKIYWAKNLKFGDSHENTLNYFIRVLGRTGVLELNVVGRMSDLPAVEQIAPKIIAAVDFVPGNQYADFKEGTDKVATYGIAALVAGGIAAKAGFFKLLWVGILAFKKLIVVGVIAAGGFMKKLFSRKKSPFTETPTA